MNENQTTVDQDAGATRINVTQNWKGKDGQMLEQSVVLEGLDNEHAMICMDKWAVYEKITNDDASGQTVCRDRYHYPPGSKYGSVEEWMKLAEGTVAESSQGSVRTRGGTTVDVEASDSDSTLSSDETADANAISADDVDLSSLQDFQDMLGKITDDAQITFTRKDGKVLFEIVIAGRKFTVDDEDFGRIRDLIAEAQSLDGEGAEEILETAIGPIPVHTAALATSGNDPFTISHPKDANNQTSTNGILAFTGFNFTAQLLADITNTVNLGVGN